jgi:hypothetical protein
VIGKELQDRIDAIQAKPSCRRRIKIDIERPHLAFVPVGKRSRGLFDWKVKQRVRRDLFCLKEPGHEGPHYDSREWISWMDDS